MNGEFEQINPLIGVLSEPDELRGSLDGPLTRGYSAYEIYLKHGGTMTEEEWLASLKGEPGDPGYTPQKGTDYWTDEDKAEMENDILQSQTVTGMQERINALGENKADKVESATDGNFASLDENGNLQDSGHKHSDYLTQHQSLANYVQKGVIADDYDPSSTYDVGDRVMRNGTMYRCKTAITTAEAWNASHWESANVDGELSQLSGDLNEKADKVSSATSGNFAGLDANGNLTDSGKKASDFLTEAPVTDVQVNGTSVLNAQGVAEIPIANSANKLGLVYTAGSGLTVQSDGKIVVQRATDEEIKIGINANKPIVPTSQNISTFYSLAKAAGDSTQSASSNAVGTYTDEAKVAIQKMLGIYEAPWELIRNGSVNNSTAEDISISVDDNGNTFELTDIRIIFHTPKQDTEASVGSYGRVKFFYSGGNDTQYIGAYTQAAQANARTSYISIEQKGKMIERTEQRNAVNNSETSILGLLYYPLVSNSRWEKVSATRVYTRIEIGSVTGIANFIVYGKRKWQ